MLNKTCSVQMPLITNAEVDSFRKAEQLRSYIVPSQTQLNPLSDLGHANSDTSENNGETY
jgi:hypothetical protein